MSEQTNRELAVRLSSLRCRGKRQFARAGGKFAGVGFKDRIAQIVSPAISASAECSQSCGDTPAHFQVCAAPRLRRIPQHPSKFAARLEAVARMFPFQLIGGLSAPEGAESKPTSSCSRPHGLLRTPHRRRRHRYRTVPWRRRPEPPARHRRLAGHKLLRQASWKRAQAPRSWR